jgi:hypothetical protein
MTKNEGSKKSAKSVKSAREKQQQIKGFLFHADSTDLSRFNLDNNLHTSA